MSSPSKIKAGSRSSPLAQAQVKEVFSLLSKAGKDMAYEPVAYETQGDTDQITPLTSNPADDFFTDTLDHALLKEEIDIAVHSAKDLPQNLREGLSIIALTASIDETDAFVGKCKFSELKPGAKVGTSSLVRQQGLKDLNPDIEPVDIRGDIGTRMRLLKDGKYDGIIVAACALKRLGLEHEITDILPWEATPLQGQLAVVAREEGDCELKEIFAAIDVRKTYGKVFLVGAGPGDPDLMTVKAVKALKKADSIFYDYLVHTDILDYASRAEKIYVGKRKGEHTLPQAELSRRLRKKAMAGKNVVRLKGGDPFIFGRGADEMEYLRAFHIRVEAVPGISSATGIPTSLGIPLTARGVSSSVAFVSGHAPLTKIPEAETLVFFMGLTNLDHIVRSLLKAGKEDATPAVVISRGTRIDEKIIAGTLGDIREKVSDESLNPPALIIVGQTVKFLQNHSGKKENILYVGTNPEKYKSLGRIIHHPMIEISQTPSREQKKQILLKALDQSDIILFTSRFAVRGFFDILNCRGQACLPPTIFAVIGKDTAFALGQYGITPQVIAKKETSVGMLSALEENYDLKGKRILFPRSVLPNPYLKEELTKRGCTVTEVAVYQNTKPAKRDLPTVCVNKVLFTSPSTIKNFLEDYGSIPDGWQILSKGPRTRESLKAAGYESEIVTGEGI